MSDLQLILIVIAAVFIVGFFAYYKWQEYCAQKRIEQAFTSHREDVLLHSVPDVPPPEVLNPRREPILNPEYVQQMKDEPQLEGTNHAQGENVSSNDLNQNLNLNLNHQDTHNERRKQILADRNLDANPITNRDTPVAGVSQDEPEKPEKQEGQTAQKVQQVQMVQTSLALGRELSVDDLIDCVIPIEFETPIKGEKLIAMLNDIKYVGKKSVHFIGLTREGEKDEIQIGSVYTAIYAGLQMANRSGPINELEYSEFVSRIREITDQNNAYADIPDMTKVMSLARELHTFVQEHDAQLGVNVISKGAPWEINTLLQALEKQGFSILSDGRLVMPDGDTGVLFTLLTNVSASDTTTHKLTLLLDVPCVAQEQTGFNKMAACAKVLAMRLGGLVVDDSDQEIAKESLDQISRQVDEFCQGMAIAEIPAGSRRAKRLFS